MTSIDSAFTAIVIEPSISITAPTPHWNINARAGLQWTPARMLLELQRLSKNRELEVSSKVQQHFSEPASAQDSTLINPPTVVRQKPGEKAQEFPISETVQ